MRPLPAEPRPVAPTVRQVPEPHCPPQPLVVMGPATTQEHRDGTHHDMRGQGRASRQAHLAQEPQWATARRPGRN